MIGHGPYFSARLDSLDSPALLVFPKLVEQNIINALKLLQGAKTRLRPHVKTVKCKEVVQMALRHGIDRFKSSTISESELLAVAGVKDVLLSYQLSAIKAKRFEKLRRLFPKTEFSSLIDNLDSAKLLSGIFREHPMDVFVDVNLGMDRTGILPGKVLDLVNGCAGLPGIRIVGLHGYDGHVHSPDLDNRRAQSTRHFEEMKRLKKGVEAYLGNKIKLILGGSPTFALYSQKDEVECSPGTFFFWDAGYKNNYPELPFVPAALVLMRIVSITNSRLLCFDLGSKAIAADPPQPRVEILHLENQRIVGQYEEHLAVTVPDTSKFKVGECFLGIPYHICPTVNLYEQMEVIEENGPEKIWTVPARNRKITV